MATTIPPVHNYESQIVFSNQTNNIKSTDVINSRTPDWQITQQVHPRFSMFQ